MKRIEDSIINSLALRYKVDKRVARFAAFHPLLFFKRVAESGDDRPVRIKYFGVFAPKVARVSKENAMKYIAKQLLKNIVDVYDALVIDWYEEYDSLDKLREAIEDALEEKNKPFLDKLWKLYKEYEKNQ
jgi:hypothetical protein